MFKLVNAEVKPLTPEIVEEFRNLEASPTERMLDPNRTKHLRQKAEAGQLVTFHWSKAKLGSRILRMNGQHSSNMLAGLNGQFPEGLRVHIDTYSVESESDLAQLFRQFDDRKSGRTPGDVAGAYQGLVTELRDVNRGTAKLAVEGVNWYQRTIEGLPAKSGDDVYTLFNVPGLIPFIRWMGELFSVKTPEMKKRTVVSAIYGTFIANETEARTFWMEVARGGVEYEDNSPQTILDGWLKSLAEQKGAVDISPAGLFQGCVFAWNAFREHKTITGIKHDTKKGLLSVRE
jgi:hypothetical protein